MCPSQIYHKVYCKLCWLKYCTLFTIYATWNSVLHVSQEIWKGEGGTLQKHERGEGGNKKIHFRQDIRIDLSNIGDYSSLHLHDDYYQWLCELIISNYSLIYLLHKKLTY